MRHSSYSIQLDRDGAEKLIDRRRFLRNAALALSAASMALIQGCSSSADNEEQGRAWLEADPQTSTLFVFDTVVSLSAYCSEELMMQLVDRCNFFESKFSRTVEGSDVWNINNAKGAPVEVESETADLIAKSLEFCERSDGLFDITIGSVSSLWDFVSGVKPKDGDVKAALSHIDYRNVQLDGTTVTLNDPEAMLDLGATAKGYIADDLCRILREGGCLSAMLNLGGNVYVLGSKPDGSPWNVGIQNPNETEGSVIASIKTEDSSVVTSGLYERQFKASDGETYYHILDPKTGYPAKTDLVSSSVVSASSLEGDAYATWMFLLGYDKALDLLKDAEGLEGMVVNEKGKTKQTQNASFSMVKG